MITLTKKNKDRTFCIKEYEVSVDYKESPYIGLDSWSTEIDVDLFYMLEQEYKKHEFCEKYTKVT
jgi:hypothetical protein